MPPEGDHQKPIRLPHESRTPGSGFARVAEPDAAVGTPTAPAPDQDELDDLIDTIRNDTETREGGEDVNDKISGETLTAIAAVVEERIEADPQRADLLARATEIEERMMRRFFRDEDRRSGSKMAHGHSQLAYEAALAAEVGARDFDLEAWKQMYEFMQLGVRELTPTELEARDRIKAAFIDPILTAVMRRVPGISQVLDPFNRHYAVELARVMLDAMYDELTGVLRSRESLRDMLRLEARRFLREAGPDEVMVTVELDFIHFKDINSAVGESNVDEFVLKPFGKKLRHPRTLRAEDLKARVGRGDEFTVVLTRINRKDVPLVLERLKAIIEEDAKRLDPQVNAEIMSDAAYNKKKLRNARIAVRVGARIWSADEIRQWDMGDSQQFVDRTLRGQAQDATHALKNRNGREILIWDESVPSRETVAPQDAMTDRVLRGISDVMADIRAQRGSQAADKFESGLRELMKEQFSNN